MSFVNVPFEVRQEVHKIRAANGERGFFSYALVILGGGWGAGIAQDLHTKHGWNSALALLVVFAGVFLVFCLIEGIEAAFARIRNALRRRAELRRWAAFSRAKVGP